MYRQIFKKKLFEKQLIKYYFINYLSQVLLENSLTAIKSLIN